MARPLVSFAAMCLCAACSTLPSGRGWGADATIRPGWERVGRAAVAAARDPWVWAPAAGALLFQLNGFDRKTSDWATEHTPVFGSVEGAERWSDNLRAATGVIMAGTLLATPSGGEPGEWLANKVRGGVVELAAMSATSIATGLLKGASGRERPNDRDDESFPSAHASSAAVMGRLAKFNLESIDLSAGSRRAAGISVDVTVIGTAWARVEAGAHFPSDVLAGIALGNYLARFATDAFFDPDARQSIAFVPVDGGGLLRLDFRF